MRVLVLHAAVHGHFAVCSACADDADLTNERHPLLHDRAMAFEGFPGRGEIGVRVHFALAFAIGNAGALNAGLFAVSILATEKPELAAKLQAFRDRQTQKVLDSQSELESAPQA